MRSIAIGVLVVAIAVAVIVFITMFDFPREQPWLEPPAQPTGVIEEVRAPKDFPAFEARHRGRQVIARELLAGRTTLPEAAAAFHRLDGLRAPLILRSATGHSAEEKLCRMVIDCVRAVEIQDGLDPVVSQNLATELECLLASDGFVGMIVSRP